MLKRKIDNILIDWKNSSNKNPLVIKGARQCGKTTSIVNFANNNYKNVVYINFIEHPEYKSLFADTLNINDIIKKMTSLYNFQIDESGKDTILIFDEIQNCGNARTSLKFFKLDGRFDVIATGSLLGVRGVGDDIVSIPVGYEDQMTMYPLDFNEFLWANGINEEIISNLTNSFINFKKIDEATHERIKKILVDYIIIGGMPKVVDEFINSHNYNKTLSIQNNIIRDYRDDVIKYANKNDKIKILECFDSITSQLSKENKKFQFSKIKKGAKSRDYESCIEWLIEAGIVVKCNNLQQLELPLDGNKIDDCFKIYMQDIGLLTSMFEEGTQFDILNNKLWTYKGAIFENLAADILSKMGKKLYYYRKDSGLEIDFVIRYKNQCIPVEIKSTTGNAKSLKTILKNKNIYHIDYAMKFGDYNVGIENNLQTFPLYMLFALKSQ